jgi:hypothetical protein
LPVGCAGATVAAMTAGSASRRARIGYPATA